MAAKRLLIYSIALLALPVAVAYWDIPTAAAVALVLVALLARVGISQSALLFPPDVPELELETIAISHYSEKVRWCMDRLGVDYVERTVAGILGVFFTGRTVPRLKIRTGATRSVIGNSPEILRYLWGAYAARLGETARFLEPTPERLTLEARIDGHARDLQIWAYYHLLDDRRLTLRAWGRHTPTVPLWQRWSLSVLFPVLRVFTRRAFQLSEPVADEAVQRCEEVLADVESGLSDGRGSLLGQQGIDFVDIAFAAVASIWLQPAEYANGKAESVLLQRDELPLRMAEDIARWTQRYPRTVAFVERLYKEERRPAKPRLPAGASQAPDG